MSQISVGSAVGSGFELIGRKPLTVLAWGLVRILFAAGILALFAPTMIGVISVAMQAAASGQSPEAINQAMLPQMMMMQGTSYLLQIGGLFLSAVLFCAVTRSIVHPERGSFAYLRVGAPELYLALVSFGAGFAIALAIMVFAIPFVIVIVILAMQKMVLAAVVVGILAAVVLIVASLYIALRFAFVVPMMVEDGQFHLFDAWSRTKGHVGSLFVIGVCLVLIAMAAELVIGALVIGLGLAALGVSAGGMANLQAFFQLPPMTIVSRLAPWLVVYGLAAIPLEGCAMAIFMAPWARAYRDVTPPPEPIAAVAPPSPEPPISPAPVTA
jgi:hypothetical protein